MDKIINKNGGTILCHLILLTGTIFETYTLTITLDPNSKPTLNVSLSAPKSPAHLRWIHHHP